HRLIGERGQVQRDVLAIGRDQIAKGVDGHFGSFQEAAIARDAVACCLSRKWREGPLEESAGRSRSKRARAVRRTIAPKNNKGGDSRPPPPLSRGSPDPVHAVRAWSFSTFGL